MLRPKGSTNSIISIIKKCSTNNQYRNSMQGCLDRIKSESRFIDSAFLLHLIYMYIYIRCVFVPLFSLWFDLFHFFHLPVKQRTEEVTRLLHHHQFLMFLLLLLPCQPYLFIYYFLSSSIVFLLQVNITYLL